MINKCKGCVNVGVCELRHGFKDLCRRLPSPVMAPKPAEPEREAVPLERYEGRSRTVGSIQPFNEFGQLVERRKGDLGKQEIEALRLERLKSRRKLFARSSAKSVLLDDSKYVPEEALSFDPEAHEDNVGGWIPEGEPDLPTVNPTRCRVLSVRKTSPFSLKLETEPMYPSGMPEVTRKQRRERLQVAQLRQICRKHLKNHPDQRLTLPLEDWLLLNKYGGVAPPSASGV